MNKKSMLKIGAASSIIIVFAVLIFLLFINVTGADIFDKDSYVLGEKVRIDLRGIEDYRIKIKGPSNTFIKEGSDDKIIFKPDEIGEYEIELEYSGEDEVYGFRVVGDIGERASGDSGKEEEKEGEIEEEKEVTDVDAEEEGEIEEKRQESEEEEVPEVEKHEEEINEKDGGVFYLFKQIFEGIFKESKEEERIFDKDSYILGEKVRFNLRNFGNYELKIITPSTLYSRLGSNDFFIFEPEEIGKYKVELWRDGGKTEYWFEVTMKIRYGSGWSENCEKGRCTRSLYSNGLNIKDLNGEYKPFTEVVKFKQKDFSQDLELSWNNKEADMVLYVVIDGEKNEVLDSMNFVTEIKQDRGLYKWSHKFTNIEGLEIVGLVVSSGSGIEVLDEDSLLIDDIEIDFSDLYNRSCFWKESEVDSENDEYVCTDSGIVVEIKQIDESSADVRISNFSGKEVLLDPTITVMLQTADSENLGDSWIDGRGGGTPPRQDSNYGVATTLSYRSRSDRPRRIYMTFNISSVPANATIDDALLCLYETSDATTPGASVCHVYIHNWSEGSLDGGDAGGQDYDTNITWNNQPCGTGFNDAGECNLTCEDYQATASTGWQCWNITNMVQTEYNNGDGNVSVVFNTTETDFDNGADVFASKEYATAGQRPYLNITYSYNTVPDTPSPLINSTDGSNYSNQDLNCFDTLVDDDGDFVNVSVRWYVNDSLNLSFDYNNSYSNGSFFNAVLDSGNTSAGENWSCSVRLYDSQDYSNWGNSTNLTVLVTPPDDPPYFDPVPENQTIWHAYGLAYNVNASDDYGISSYNVNDTANFVINGSGFLSNNTLLSPGVYNINISVNDTSNQWNSSIMMITVNYLNISISETLNPNSTDPGNNITVYGHVNFTNGSDLNDHPINIWLDGELLLLANLTPIGSYNFYQNKTDTDSGDFNKGGYSQTTTDGENVTLVIGNISGNFTKILDAGARVEWNVVSWIQTLPECSGVKTFQQGDSNSYLGTEDTYMSDAATNTSFGGSADLLLDAAPTLYRTLIKFGDIIGKDINKILPNSTINEANITIEIYNTGNDFSVYEVLENWTENQASYNNRFTGIPWNQTGCSAYPSRSNTLESTGSGSSSSSTFDVSNAMRRWANGTSDNYGVVLVEGGGDNVNIRSSEYSSQSERPLLRVSYNSSDCTGITVYIRTSNDKVSWTGWQEINNGGLVNDSNMASRYLQYRVEMTTTETTETPYLEEIVVNYTAVVTNGSGDYEYNFTSPSTSGSHPVNVSTGFLDLYNESVRYLISTGPPSVPQLNAPENNSILTSIIELNWTNSTDYEGDFISYILIVDNNSDFSSPEYYNGSIAETVSPTGDTPLGLIDGVYYWRVLAFDSSTNSSWSDVWQFTLDTTAPNLTFINQTDEDGLIVNESNPLEEGQNLTLNVEVDDDNLDSVWVIIWETVKGGAELFRGFFALISGNLWSIAIPTNYSWGLSYNYTIYANDSAGWESEYDGNFSLLKMNVTINLSSVLVGSSTNVTVFGYLNFTNGSDVADHPINIWFDGELLLLANLTPIGSYNFYQNKTDTDSSDFNKGSYSQTTTDGENVTLVIGNTSGNFTKILNPGARVEWDIVSWTEAFPSCNEQIISFQEGDANDYNGTRDAYIDSGTADTNYGSDGSLIVDGSPIERALIEFSDIMGSGNNQIPFNSTINMANVSIVVFDAGSDTTIYEVLENWTESEVTYNNRTSGVAWSSTGCAGSPSRATTAENTFSPAGTGTYTFNITNAVQRWINASSSNYGVVLDPGGGNSVNMRSSEYGTQGERPELTVAYVPPNCTTIKVYIRTSNDKVSWTSWQEVSNGGAVNDSNIASQYLEYRVEMTSEDNNLTPYFQDITANYTAVVTNGSGNYEYNFTSPETGGVFDVNTTTYYRTIFGEANITLTVTGTPSRPLLNAPANDSYLKNISVLNWTNSTDYEGDPIFYILIVDNNSDFSSPEYYNGSIAETVSPTGDTPFGLIDGRYYWKARAYDNVTGNSSWSDVWQFTLDTTAPNLTFINQTDEDGLIVNATNQLEEGGNLTINVEVDDDNVDSVWIIIWEGVVGVSGIIWQGFLSLVLGNLWSVTIETNETFPFGEINYTIYANDSAGWESQYNGTFDLVKMNITLDLDPNPVNITTNITAFGYLNFTNASYLGNYPINLWLNGTLLLLSNLTPNGNYDNYQNRTDTSSDDFNKGSYYQTTTDGENLTLSGINASGNFTRILDAGAMVEWNNVIWQYAGAGCSGVASYQEGDSNGYSETRDTYIDSDSSDSNYGTEQYLSLDTSPGTQRGLIKFNNIIGFSENQIPPNSTISASNVTIEVYDAGDDFSVYEILENWTGGDATYNNRLAVTGWSQTGCSAYPSRSNTLEATVTAGSTGPATFDITNAFNRWVNGTSENYGVVFHPGGSNLVGVRSSEYSNQSERPLLSVGYNSSDCTSIKVYVRTSNDRSNWGSWQEVSNGGLVNDSNLASRYLEYRVDMSTVNSSLKPYLEEIVINYTAVVTNGSGYYSYNFSSPLVFGYYPVLVNTSYRTAYAEASAILSLQLGVDPEVELISPNDSQWFSYGNLTLVYNASDINDDIVKAELIINGQVNATNSSVVNNGQYSNFTINFNSGGYNWTVNVTDSNNNVGTDTERRFYIDLEDPNVTLVYPPNDSNFSVSELNLSFNVTDNMDGVLDCDVVLDGSIIDSVSANNSEITNVSSGTLGNGLHYWNVTCTDEVGRQDVSQTWVFNISDTPPSVTLVWPDPNYIDDDGDISFVFNATDDSGFINCSLYIDDVFNSTNQTEINNGMNTSINVTGFGEGNYNWTVECFDLGENSDIASARNFSVDLYYPTIDLNLPSSGDTLNYSDVDFNFTVNDSLDNSLDCNLTIDGIVDGFNATAGLLTNRPISDLTDGLKYWNVTCEDDVGHSNTSATWTVNISEPPTVYLNTSNGSSYSIGSVTLDFTPFDNTNFSSCDLYLDDVFNKSNETVVANGQENSFDVDGLLDGMHTWYVNCTDVVGLIGVSARNVFYIDSNPPNITLYYPDGDEVYAANITFNFTVEDAVDSVLLCNISIDGDVDDPNFNASNGTVTNRTIAGITDGYHTWYVNCTDDAGNSGGSLIFNFTKYTKPSVSLVYPDDGWWFNTSDFNLTYLPQDDMGISIAYLIINGQVNRTNLTEVINGANNNFTITDFKDGSYNWTVNVTDVDGLNGTDSERTFYVDTQAPDIVLNYPNESEVVITNNISFNFTPTDNLDESISCNLSVDGDIEYSGDVSNGTDSVNYILVVDGNHTWNVTCWDNASNYNYSETRNFTVEAPPNVTLDDPPNWNRTRIPNVTFIYTPIDPIGINNCSLYIDGVFNQTEPSPVPNQQNNFSVYGFTEGQHNWSVGCFDPDDNYFEPSAIYFVVDMSPPYIILENPENDSKVDYGSNTVSFTWRAVDALDSFLRCNLTIDGIINNTSPILVSSNISNTEIVSGFSLGEHYWNVTCWDHDFTSNVNTSETRVFNVSYVDLAVNTSDIAFNTSNPKEDELVVINATIHNFGGADAEDVVVSFYIGDPDSGGQQINGNQTVNVSAYGENITSVLWNASRGPSNIFVVVDPPLATNGSFLESNESNNKANRSIVVGSWQTFYGSMSSVNEYVLDTNSNQSVIRWLVSEVQGGNIYVSDYESIVFWSDLFAIGKNISGQNTSNDFVDIDSLLNMTGYTDSVSNLYLEAGQIRDTTDFMVFQREVESVPWINSTNNTNFITGILWDSSDDADGEFSQGDKEDLVFATKVNESGQGAYGVYDYEIRVPAALREYNTTNSESVIFYIELL